MAPAGTATPSLPDPSRSERSKPEGTEISFRCSLVGGAGIAWHPGSYSMTLGFEFAATLAEAKLGDEQAIGRLYRDVQPRLLGYLATRVPRAAEDLASEVWLAVARGLPSFEGDEAAWLGYLFTIARHKVADHWRQAKRRRTDLVEPAAFLDHEGSSNVETEGLEAIASSEAVALVVKNLSKEQADVVLLRVVAGLDVEQVARILDKKPGTIRVIQHRAVKRLAALMPGLAVTR